MNLRTLVPFKDNNPFVAMQREMDRMLDHFFRSDSPTTRMAWPSVDVRETEKEFKVYAELPGLDERDVEITFADGVLTLKGEKRIEEETALYSERWAGSFERRIVVSEDVDPDDIKARFRNGVLTITLGKKPEAQRQVKRIAIN